MRQLVMWNLVTLDGCFEGTTPWSIGWHDDIWGTELERFAIDQVLTGALIIFGARTRAWRRTGRRHRVR